MVLGAKEVMGCTLLESKTKQVIQRMYHYEWLDRRMEIMTKETRAMKLKLEFSLSDAFENWSGTDLALSQEKEKKKKKNIKIILIYFPSSEN